MSALRIYIKFYDKATIMCKESDLIQSILQEYEEKTGIPYEDLQFLHGDTDLSEHCKHTVGELKIKDGQTIYVGGKQRGFSTLSFNSMEMENSIHKKFSKGAKKWRKISKGLNLEGRCKNPKCQAYNRKVWIKKGFGEFNMNKEVKMAKCPICQQFCKQVNNMGLFMAVCQGKGLIEGQEKEKNIFSEHKQKTGFLTYEDRDETRCQWDYLNLSVDPIKNL